MVCGCVWVCVGVGGVGSRAIDIMLIGRCPPASQASGRAAAGSRSDPSAACRTLRRQRCGVHVTTPSVCEGSRDSAAEPSQQSEQQRRWFHLGCLCREFGRQHRGCVAATY